MVDARINSTNRSVDAQLPFRSVDVGELISLGASSRAPDNGKAVGDDTEHLEHNLLAMLGTEEWEGVAVGFLLAKVRYC